jgi:uncharacterized protein (TIGR00297 family)
VLVALVGGLLGLFAVTRFLSLTTVLVSWSPQLLGGHERGDPLWTYLTPWMVSLTFGLVVWAVRAATLGGVFSGSAICLAVILGAQGGIWPLIALFVLTFAATRAGRRKKEQAGLAESRRGRTAGQVIANLGVAGLVGILGYLGFLDMILPVAGYFMWTVVLVPVLLTAALCEATADTVSSEIGQAFGGTPRLVTNFRAVPPGTDGAVSARGTLAGMAAALVVALVAMFAMRMTVTHMAVAWLGGVAGLWFDSLLGATIERRGWVGNDAVNFNSTAFAVLVAVGLLVVWR